MSGRLPSGLLVSALLRRVNDDGGMGMLLARGDAQGGGILVIIVATGGDARVLERGIGRNGVVQLIEWKPQVIENASEITDYWQRRRRSDPDLWVVELDSPFAERFAAETILGD